MKMDWFVIQTLTGKEGKVQESIQARAKKDGMEDFIGECLIPTEKVTENKNGKKRTLKRKIFPGYVLLQMALFDDSAAVDPETHRRAVYDRTWQFLRETPGVIIGSWLRRLPTPLTEAEMEAIVSNKPAPAAEKPRPTVVFNIGETVKLNEGAFMGLTGLVSMVDPDKGKLKVEVQVFSRKVPVDVDYWQVEKVPLEDIAAQPEA